MRTGFFATTTDQNGKSVSKELTGIKVELSVNGSFICFRWVDDEDKSISCNFKIVEDDLREFLENKDLKHGYSRLVYGEYWKII